MVALTAPAYSEEKTFIDGPHKTSELTSSIDSRTFRQVRDLRVEHAPDRVVLKGRSGSYYVKQLATHAVLDLLPGIAVENCIDVTR